MNILKTSGNESVVARSSLWVNMSRLYFSCSKLNFHVPGRLNICESSPPSLSELGKLNLPSAKSELVFTAMY